MGPDGIHERISRKPVGNAHQATFHHLPTSWLMGKVPGTWRLDNVTLIYLQEGPERWFRELEACQPNLGAREGYGAGHSECLHMAYAGIGPNQHKHGFMKSNSCLSSLISIYSKVTLGGRGKDWILFSWTLVKSLHCFPHHSTEKTGCSMCGRMHCSVGKKSSKKTLSW